MWQCPPCHHPIAVPRGSLNDHFFCKPIGIAEPHVTLPYNPVFPLEIVKLFIFVEVL